MSDNIECPFCGTSISTVSFEDTGLHPSQGCPLSTFVFTKAQWAMRPPKQEAPAPAIMSEVEFLRLLVTRLVIEPEPEPQQYKAIYRTDHGDMKPSGDV